MNKLFRSNLYTNNKTGLDYLKNHFLTTHPIIKTDDTNNIDQAKQYADMADFVWIIDKDVTPLSTFPWYFKPKENDCVYLFPYVCKGLDKVKNWHSAKLVPTKNTIKKTIKQKNIFSIYDPYYGKEKFDIFYIGNTRNLEFSRLQNQYPNIKTVDSYNQAVDLSETDMFWMIPDNVVVLDSFTFDYRPDNWSLDVPHIFPNSENNDFDGIVLFPKSYKPSDRELEFKFYIEKKYVYQQASKPRLYDCFIIETYTDYLDALKNTTTEMFWGYSNKILIKSTFPLDLYFTHDNNYDRKQNHAFIHEVDGKKTYDGVFLFSKHNPVTEREVTHRHLVECKEWDIVASGPKLYDRFVIDTYEEYQHALENTTTEMFWGTSRNIEIAPNFEFDLYFDNRSDEYLYERNENHAFIHRVDDVDYYNGVYLFSKNKTVSKREIEKRFIFNRKEWDIIASGPKKYDQFVIDTYAEYLAALENTTTEMFWGTSRNIEVLQDFKFDLFFDDRDDSRLYERNENHAFIHRVNNVDYYNGVFLFSKNKPVTEREIDHRHLVERKEWGIVASGPKLYDRFLVDTYEEYLQALENATTEMFWAISRNVDTAGFDFNTYFTHDNNYDRVNNHAFAHEVNGKKYFNGIFLLPKNVKQSDE